MCGVVYMYTRVGNIKVANKRFSTSKHNYEINFDSDAIIVESDDGDKIDSVKYSFSKIRDVVTKSLPCTIDLVGIVKEFKPVGKITPKNSSEELVRRTITVVDSSECAIEITLWQTHATKFDEATLMTKPLVAFKGVSVKEYNGARTLSTMQQTLMVLVAGEEDCGGSEIVKETQSWWAASPSGDFFNVSAGTGLGNTPGAPEAKSHTVVSIADMKEECKRGFFGEKGIFFDIVAKLSFISTKGKESEIPIYYSACTSCNRKLSDDNRCFACDKTVAVPQLKYLLRAQFIDASDQGYLSVFDAQALTILKKPVEDVLRGTSVADELKKTYFETDYLLRVKATGQEFKGEMRPRITVIAAEPIDPVSRGRKLLKKIIDKIGKELPTEVITEKEDVIPCAMDEDEPECKKMRIDESGQIEPMAVEAKE